MLLCCNYRVCTEQNALIILSRRVSGLSGGGGSESNRRLHRLASGGDGGDDSAWIGGKASSIEYVSLWLLVVDNYSIQYCPCGTNRKPIYDFLLVINSNLPLILHRFREMQSSKGPKSLHFSTPDKGVPLGRSP